MNGYGVYEFMPSAGVLMDNMRWVCESSQIGSSLCTYVIRDLFGHSSLPTPPVGLSISFLNSTCHVNYELDVSIGNGEGSVTSLSSWWSTKNHRSLAPDHELW